MKQLASLVLAVLFLVNSAVVHSQSGGAYPTRALRILVAQAPGGQVDLLARSIAPLMSAGLGQQVVVENRPSASGILGAQLVARSAPDGYTLLPVANTFAIVPTLVSTAGYDPVKDFAGVSLFALVPQVLVATPTLPVRSAKELVALAKGRPNQVSYASAGTGTTGHLAAELLSRHVGIQMLHVPYKGNSQSIVDVMAGNVAVMFDQIGTSIPYIRAGKLRALAVTSRARSPLLPQLPTVDESGAKGFEDITFIGFAVAAGTPRDILLRLNSEVSKAVRTQSLRDRFQDAGVELASSATPEEFSAQIKTEIDKKSWLIREAGIKME